MLNPVQKLAIYNDRVDKAIKGKGRRVLYKVGAYVRTTMRNLMRYGNASSRPGQPPASHKKTGAGLRNLIEFDVDTNAETVSIGPVLKSDSKLISNKPLPQLLNEGGTVSFKGRSVTIAPRPFIEPANEVGFEKFLQLVEQEKLRD